MKDENTDDSENVEEKDDDNDGGDEKEANSGLQAKKIKIVKKHKITKV